MQVAAFFLKGEHPTDDNHPDSLCVLAFTYFPYDVSSARVLVGRQVQSRQLQSTSTANAPRAATSMTGLLRAFTDFVMGSCQSTEVKVQTAVSKQIDKQLYAQKARMIQKLLLLGPGESGKSTCLKQMQILHNNGFTQAEIEDRKCIVYSNTVQSMLAITSNMPNLGIALDDPKLDNGIQAIQRHVDGGFETSAFSPEVKAALAALWADGGVRAAYEKRSQYQLNDSAKYFFDNLERIARKDYTPTEQDILYTRVATAGVVQVTFTANNIDFNTTSFQQGSGRSASTDGLLPKHG
uniref:Guanine nucleotide-binding protein G(O) subunit alpha n=1 Tax=Steinernema glaseri TaxID=37863 RepID=A0A1I7Z6U2_9BILA